jgi:hypothetical protein
MKFINALVVKLVDTKDLKSVALGRTGSSPVGSTTLKSLIKIEHECAQKCADVQCNVHKSAQQEAT